MRRTGVLHRAVRRRLDAARGDRGTALATRSGGARADRASGRRTSDSGMTAIEFVVLTPVLFFMIFATVQFALYFFADHVAQAAAQAGARRRGPKRTRTPAAGAARRGPPRPPTSSNWDRNCSWGRR